jgi:hypothetical protein
MVAISAWHLAVSLFPRNGSYSNLLQHLMKKIEKVKHMGVLPRGDDENV